MPPQSGATPELSATVANSSIDAQQEPQIKSAMSRNLVVFALGLAILVGILVSACLPRYLTPKLIALHHRH
jgi:hypothetical protein